MNENTAYEKILPRAQQSQLGFGDIFEHFDDLALIREMASLHLETIFNDISVRLQQNRGTLADLWYVIVILATKLSSDEFRQMINAQAYTPAMGDLLPATEQPSSDNITGEGDAQGSSTTPPEIPAPNKPQDPPTHSDAVSTPSKWLKEAIVWMEVEEWDEALAMLQETDTPASEQAWAKFVQYVQEGRQAFQDESDRHEFEKLAANLAKALVNEHQAVWVAIQPLRSQSLELDPPNSAYNQLLNATPALHSCLVAMLGQVYRKVQAWQTQTEEFGRSTGLHSNASTRSSEIDDFYYDNLVALRKLLTEIGSLFKSQPTPGENSHAYPVLHQKFSESLTISRKPLPPGLNTIQWAIDYQDEVTALLKTLHEQVADIMDYLEMAKFATSDQRAALSLYRKIAKLDPHNGFITGEVSKIERKLQAGQPEQFQQKTTIPGSQMAGGSPNKTTQPAQPTGGIAHPEERRGGHEQNDAFFRNTTQYGQNNNYPDIQGISASQADLTKQTNSRLSQLRNYIHNGGEADVPAILALCDEIEGLYRDDQRNTSPGVAEAKHYMYLGRAFTQIIQGELQFNNIENAKIYSTTPEYKYLHNVLKLIEYISSGNEDFVKEEYQRIKHAYPEDASSPLLTLVQKHIEKLPDAKQAIQHYNENPLQNVSELEQLPPWFRRWSNLASQRGEQIKQAVFVEWKNGRMDKAITMLNELHLNPSIPLPFLGHRVDEIKMIDDYISQIQQCKKRLGEIASRVETARQALFRDGSAYEKLEEIVSRYQSVSGQNDAGQLGIWLDTYHQLMILYKIPKPEKMRDVVEGAHLPQEDPALPIFKRILDIFTPSPAQNGDEPQTSGQDEAANRADK